MTDVKHTAGTDFDTISDDDLVELLGLDEVSELFTNTFNGHAMIAVCDGMWVHKFGDKNWHFEVMGHVFP